MTVQSPHAKRWLRSALTITLTGLSVPAFAHSGHGEGLVAGFLHPVSGADHVLAMVAVGLWAAFRGGKAVLAWPVAFITAMMMRGLVAGAKPTNEAT